MPANRFTRTRDRLVTHYGWRMVRALDRVLAQQSLVGNSPILDNQDFTFVDDFTESWEVIRDEVLAILRHRAVIPAFHEISPEQRYISVGDNWRTFMLFGLGKKLERNCSHVPATTALLEGVPHVQTAWFSILAPGYHIPAYSGLSKGFVRVHLALVVPRDAQRCRMRVGDQLVVWHPGEVFVLDDTYVHEVWNDTPDERIVLIVDIDRPMRTVGRLMNATFARLVKRSAFYSATAQRMAGFEEQFDSAVRQAGSDNSRH